MQVTPRSLGDEASSAGADGLRLAVRRPAAVRPVALLRLGPTAPLLLPAGLLLAGALVGMPFTLDAAVAWERMVGLLLAGAVGLLGLWLLRRLPDERLPWALLAAVAAAAAGGLWIVAADGARVFRGPVGDLLQRLLAPTFGWATITESIWIYNTRFIVGYNGLADLCLVAIFAAGALFAARPRPRRAALAAAIALPAVVVLLGTGSRGGVLGLLAGLWLVAVTAWRGGWVLALLGVPLAVATAALGILDKGLETTSTTGRLAIWTDWARLLAEYPLTGVGLGLDTAYRVVLAHEVNPDPERIVYAHNTVVQTYLELGPLGTLGMLYLPLLALLAALLARRESLSRPRRALIAAGVGLVAGIEAHGLTDQVATTTVGTALLLLAAAAVLASAGPRTQAALATATRRLAMGTLGAAVLALALALALPAGRAQLLLNLGGLQLNQATLRESGVDQVRLATAERTLEAALAQDPGHPAVLRTLARARLARYDVLDALVPLRQAAGSPRLDAFDSLQIAHLYRDLGFANEAYAWATRAYEAWGRTPPVAVMQPYRQATVPDDFRVRTLVEQAEAAMRGQAYDQALPLFLQALVFAPDSTYLRDRVGAAERGVYRQQVRDGLQTQ